MGRKYKNPPVVEALCEFQFIPSQLWDITIPGLIYERVKDNFPDKQEQMSLSVQFHPTERGFEHKAEIAPPRVQFYKKDKTALIQIAQDLLAVNQLKPYPRWEIFKSMIFENLQIFKEVTNPKGFKRIGLRYINIFEFSQPNVKLEDYFRFNLYIPEDLPQNMQSFFTRVEFPFEEGNEILILALSSLIPKRPGTTSILLDIDYSMVKPDSIPLTSANDWLDLAHQRIEEAFEKSITEKQRETFEGKD
ncbi:MAG: TIGR04255 family protein [Thermodesulfovibrionales bacterium]